MTKVKNILKRYTTILLCCFFLQLSSQNPFIENKGQFPKQVIAKVSIPSGSLFIEKNKLKYVFYSGKKLAEIHDLKTSEKTIKGHAYTVDFVDSNKEVKVDFLEKSRYYENYFIGEKNSWAKKVRSYKVFFQKNIYKDIHAKYYIEGDKLKYDIIVDPNASVNKIKIKYTGVEKIKLISNNLKIKTSVNTVTEHQPYAYQKINGKEVRVKCNYILKKNILSFDFPEGYNKNYQLTIDPVLEFSTYSGSTTDNFGYTATYDNLGFLYSGSTSFGGGYPTTLGAYQIDYANSLGGTDIAITKYDTTGTERIYSTYLGGNLDELPHSMIVNSANELFVYGTTASADFPTTASVFQPNFNGGTNFSPSGIGVSFPNGSDIFVSRLSAGGGDLLASTFIGGTGNDGLNTSSKLRHNYADEVRGEIDIDKQNNIYIATCTNSADFPTKNSFQNNFQGAQEGCIIKMDNQLTSIIWGSYVGGSNDDAIYSLALDYNNNIYVTGGTNSYDFPTTPNAYQKLHQDSIKADAFVTKILSNGNQIVSSTYFGSNQYDQSYFVEIGKDNSVYLFGQTKASGNQFIKNATYSVSSGSQFISVFNEDLSDLLKSTVVGTGKGTPDISPTAFLVDVCDKIYISGWGSNLGGGTLSTLNLPITDSAYQQSTDGNDIYLMVLDNTLSSIIYATYFGGSQSNEHVDGGTSRFDKKGVIYQSVCAGCGGNSDFPIEPNPGAVSPTNNSSNCNNGVFKFNFDFPMVVADFTTTWVGCDTMVSFQNLTTSSINVSYIWDFGDGTISNNTNPTHVFNQNGLHEITLIANDNNACNITDTIKKQIYILSNSSQIIQDVFKCPEEQVQIGLLPVNDSSIDYFWFPTTNLSAPNISNPFCDINTNQDYQLLVSNGSCTDTLLQQVVVMNLNLSVTPDTFYCNQPVLLKAIFSDSINIIQWSSNVNFTDTLSDSLSLIIEEAGVFYVKVYNEYCTEIDSVIVMSESINIDVFGNDVCFGEPTVVGVTNSNPDQPLISYTWNINDLDTNIFIDFPDTSSWYVLEAINLDACILRDSIFINVFNYPVIDSIWVSETTVFKGQDLEIEVFTNDNISWEDFDDSNRNQKFFAEESQCYVFEVFNEFNCTKKDSVCIDVKDVFCDNKKIEIPNAFSPNKDNINDTYLIKDEDKIVTKFKLEIFNRLGQKVFSSADIFNTWDGTFRGEELNPQVFDFYLELECIGEKKMFYKGNITLIR